MLKSYPFIVFIIGILYSIGISAQEIVIFRTSDFDLKGNVQSCHVITNYGKEEYYFDINGLLSKSVTRYNAVDYDVTYYKYVKGILLEKRLENYRDNLFDKTTSIANFYTIDTLKEKKITEKIVSYNKEFLEQHEYYYKADTLYKIVNTNNRGSDEIQIISSEGDNEKLKSYRINEMLQETVSTSERIINDTIVEKTIQTKKYLGGAISSMQEDVFLGGNKVLSKRSFFNEVKNKFDIVDHATYHYDSEGVLQKREKLLQGKVIEEKEYVFQFDAFGNWVKEIIKPDNTYTSRKIEYYKTNNEAKSELLGSKED